MTPALLLLAFRALLALLLYAFLALVLLTLWKDMRAAHTEVVPSAHLLVVEGPGQGSIHPLAEVNTLGRAADNTISLPDETVSTHHARLHYHGGQWWLEDLGSRNGSWVNDIPVEQPLVITYGDALRLGRVVLRLSAGSPRDLSPSASRQG